MMKHASVKRSTELPDYLIVSDPAEKRRAQLLGEVELDVLSAFKSGIMNREAFDRSVPNIDHGLGVREAKCDMSIWEVRGDKIYRKEESQREVEAVLSSLRQQIGGDESEEGNEVISEEING